MKEQLNKHYRPLNKCPKYITYQEFQSNNYSYIYDCIL